MALCLCRFIFSCPFSRQSHFPLKQHQQQKVYISARFDLSCPPKSYQFTALSLPHRHQHKQLFRASISTPSSSSPPSSMENPPQGYRRNVGICLMNPSSKKVTTLCTTIICIYIYISHSTPKDMIFMLSLSCVDFCCVKTWYPRSLANAPGKLYPRIRKGTDWRVFLLLLLLMQFSVQEWQGLGTL